MRLRDAAKAPLLRVRREFCFRGLMLMLLHLIVKFADDVTPHGEETRLRRVVSNHEASDVGVLP
jgi:hypothetical protein